MRILKCNFFVLALMTTVALTSCGKNDSDDGATADSDTYIRFTIDDTEYDFKDVITAESLSLTLNANNGEGITNYGDTQITLWLPLDYATDTYDIYMTFSRVIIGSRLLPKAWGMILILPKTGVS